MMLDSFSDEEIISRIKIGDIESYKYLVEKYQKKIYSIGMRFFRNSDDSSDFTQEVFIKAFNKIDSFKGISSFKYWLSRIAYNHGINCIKAYKQESEYAEYMHEKEKETPEKIQIDKEIKKILLIEIEKLPEKYKICLDLYFFMGLSYNEIKNITGFPVNTIKSHVFRSKKILYNNLSGTIVEEYNEM